MLSALDTAFTPVNASNKLIIEVQTYLACAVNAKIIIGYIEQGTAGAIASGILFPNDSIADKAQPLTIRFEMTAGAGARTYHFVYGAEDTSAVTANGAATARKLGGTLFSSLTVTEIEV